MRQLFFWNSWPKQYRWVYRFLLLASALSMVLFVVAWRMGPGLAIGWETVSMLEPVKGTADIFRVGLFELEVTVENLLLMESFRGGSIEMHPWISYVFLLLVALGCVVLVSIVTALSRFWYIVGMAGFTALLLCFRFEQLLLFGSTGNLAFILVMLLYFPASYYFHAIKPYTPFLSRILVFALATLVLAIMVYYFSDTPYPFLYLSTYGSLGPVILSVVFVFLIAHDIVAGLVYLVTSGNNEYSKNSLLHFAVISLVYLIAVLLTYLNNTRAIQWDILYLDPFLLLIVSAAAGLWGFRKRESLFANILPFNPLGGWLYLSLGLICFTTLAYFFATANDPLIEAFEDVVVYSHLCLGGIFFLYVLSNFSPLLNRNLQVHKVLYKPKNMPFYIARMAGILGAGLLLFTADMFPYRQAVAGYYNELGDLYAHTGQPYLAERNYKIARQHEFQNHHSNYALASLAHAQGDDAKALTYFEEALLRDPSQQAYINLSRIHQENGGFFDALFTLEEGLKAFPESGPIQNNLALLYAGTDVRDSAYLYFELALHKSRSRNPAEANMLALLGKSRATMPFDSLRSLYASRDYTPVKNNLLALANLDGRHIPGAGGWPAGDSVLNYNTLINTYSYTLNQLRGEDSTYISSLRSMLEISVPSFFEDRMRFSYALSNYYHGNVREAFKALNSLKETSRQPGYHNYILGLWALQQDAPELAADYFEQAILTGYPQAIPGKALALSEAGDLPAAAKEWAFLASDSLASGKVRQMLAATGLTPPWQIAGQDDAVKYLIVRYQAMPVGRRMAVIENIGQVFYRAAALVSHGRIQLEQQDYEGLGNTLQMLEGMNITDPALKKDATLLVLEGMVGQEDFTALSQKLRGLREEAVNREYAAYYRALLYRHQGEAQKAKALFDVLARANPFFEKGVIAAASFYQGQEDGMLAYNTLLDALHTNNKSVALYKAYILQSLRVHLTGYAENALEELKRMVSPADFKRFKDDYDAVAAASEPAF